MLEASSPVEKSPIAVYFLGSGNLAVPVLRQLLDHPAVELVGAGTQPDRPGGRRRRLIPTPVGKYARQVGLLLDKPDSVKSAAFLRRLQSCRPEIVVVVSFGQILPPSVLDLPPHGCLNVHASVLPAHRGASPIAAAILAGDSETGVSFMRMEKGLDTGPLYSVHRLPVGEQETAEELEARLGQLAERHIVEVLMQVCRSNCPAAPQDHARATYAGKIAKEAARIDWRDDAGRIARCIRAFQPWPRVTCRVETKCRGPRQIQIVRGRPVELDEQYPPGTVCQVDRGGFTIACGQGGIRVERLIPAGSRAMEAECFLRGHPLVEGAAAT